MENREVIICLGANDGDREKAVVKALEWLGKYLRPMKSSPLYETPDSHGGPKRYVNAVCRGVTSLSLKELEAATKEYEKSNGRDALARSQGIVPIDMDVVVFDNKVIREKDSRASYFLAGLTLLV